MSKKTSNIISMVVRGTLTPEEREWILSPKMYGEDTVTVVEKAIGWEGGDISPDHHEHVHVVVRLSEAIPNDTKFLRAFFELGKWTNIQDIQGAHTSKGEFERAANYACKSGVYEWETQTIYPPYDIAEPQWNPLQKRILNILQNQNYREILVVIEKKGNTGKSFLANWLEIRFKATMLTVASSYKDVMREAYICATKANMNMSTIFVDIPKAYPQKELKLLYAATETLKDGRIMDDRYENKRKRIRSPKICIFTNEDAPINALTPDRWKVLVAADMYHFDEYNHESYRRYLEMMKKQEQAREADKKYYETHKEEILAKRKNEYLNKTGKTSEESLKNLGKKSEEKGEKYAQNAGEICKQTEIEAERTVRKVATLPSSML